MKYLMLDTALLAVPNYAVDAQTGDEIIGRVMHFSEVCTSEIPVKLQISSQAEEALWGNNIGPDYDQICDFLDMLDLSHIYSAHDLIKSYHILLERCSRVATDHGAEVEDFDDFHSTPAMPLVTPLALGAESQRVLVDAALLRQSGVSCCVASGFSQPAGAEVKISTRVLSLRGPRPMIAGSFPLKVEASVPLITHLTDMASSYCADQFWEYATNEKELHFAVVLGALAIQMKTGEQPSYARLKKFSLGTGFFQSLAQVEASGSGRFASTVREVCSQIVAGKCQRRINPFSLRGQYSRSDGSKAFRVHITESGLALRLMYWEGGSSGLEFANVDVKAGEVIDYGDPDSAVTVDAADCLCIT